MVVISFSIFQVIESFQKMRLHKTLSKSHACLWQIYQPILELPIVTYFLKNRECAIVLIISPSPLMTIQLSGAPDVLFCFAFFTHPLAVFVNTFLAI